MPIELAVRRESIENSPSFLTGEIVPDDHRCWKLSFGSEPIQCRVDLLNLHDGTCPVRLGAGAFQPHASTAPSHGAEFRGRMV